MLLESARAKFNRGRDLRRSLLSTGDTWIQALSGNPANTAPVEKRTELWGDGEVITYSVGKSNFEPPKEFGLILGDALCNYRASLDHLAWELMNQDGPPKNPKWVYFPIVEKSTEFKSDLRRKLPDVLPAVSAIVRRHQPFTKGADATTHPLWILNRWANDDKHRALHVVATYPIALDTIFPNVYPNFTVIKHETPNVEYMLPGTDLLRIFGKRIDPDNDHGVVIAIGGGSMALAHESGRTLEDTFDGIDHAVDSILSEFERLE